VLKSLKAIFKADEQETPSNEHELKLAAATLMFELVRSDGQVDQVELAQMRKILREEFVLDETELDELFDQAETTALEAISLHSFTREICDNWGNEKRLKLLEYLWILAFADEKIDAHERHLVRKVAGLLYLNEGEIRLSREAAKKHLGLI